MSNREKVINGLGDISAYFRSTLDAMIGGTLACELFRVYAETAESAIALLKAQEPKPVHVTADINHRKIGECPTCGKPINSGDYQNYCGNCGQAVKWE